MCFHTRSFGGDAFGVWHHPIFQRHPDRVGGAASPMRGVELISKSLVIHPQCRSINYCDYQIRLAFKID